MTNEMITYLELLKRIENGTQPKEIMVFGRHLYWYDDSYRNHLKEYCNIIEYFENDLEIINNKCIEIIQEETEIKQIEKLDNDIYVIDKNINVKVLTAINRINYKINELIDTVNKLTKENKDE